MSCSESPKFRLLDSIQTGIDFSNTITETENFNVMTYEYIYNGAGVGVGDLNNDGLPDLVFAGNMNSSRVYLNQGNFKFRDITSNFVGLTNNQWYSGVSMVDIDSNGWLDVYLTSTTDSVPERCKNRLWINGGVKDGKDPVFTEMAEKYGIAEDGQSVAAGFFDYDRDGYLDLYVLNNTVNQRMNNTFGRRITDGSALNNDQLYHNNGNGTFSKVTIPAGIVYEGYGLGLAMGDVNKDGYPDIYVSNDFLSNDLLYINQKDGTFRNEIKKYLSYQSKSSMGDDIADINNDGNPDIITLDMMPEYYYKKRQTINGFAYIFYEHDAEFGLEHQYLRNMLHVHNGFLKGEMLPYSEVGQMAEIYQTNWSWSPLFADYDNDGDKDLIITNGYPKDLTDKDWTKYKVKMFGFLADAQHVIDMAPAVKIPNEAFENTGNLKFIDRTKEWLPDIPSYSYGAAFTDLDNDGDLDYVVNNLDVKAFILRNYTVERSKKKAGYIKIRLIGKEGNTMGIGAKIDLWSNGNHQFIEHFLTRGYASSVDPVIHFGLGANAVIDSMNVTWPASGNVSLLKNVGSNQTIEINENNSVPPAEHLKSPYKENLMFSKRNDVLDYIHEQNDFIDFHTAQYIIPHKFSQIGPAMAKGDIDGDGIEDLIIGSTNKLPTIVFLRKGKGFVRSEFAGLTTMKEFTESDLAIIDADGDGDNDVIALAGGYENPREEEYQHYIYENRGGSFMRTSLPVPPFPASVVRPCDFDHDGDIDLFIGSRVKKGMFPYSSHSWLLINDRGKFVADTAFKLNLGMVTDAVWTDYDNDGWQDLMIAREWNSIVIMKNMNGKELVAQNIPGFEDHQGIWYSIAAGDFDQDGDDDYIAGNLGQNHRFTVSEKYPMSIYVIDLDLDGIIDPVSTAWWKDKDGVMKEYPINYLDELWAQSTYFKKTLTDYASFSYSSIDEILSPDILKRLEFKLQVNTTSSYIIWNDKGSFRWEKLPESIQVSPVRKMIIKDFNGDKYPDILEGGNDYTYDVSTGYYDADKGIVLLSKGSKQAFDVLPPSQSGILLQGMLESLLWFQGDTSLVISGFNRAKAEVFEYHK